MPENKAKRKSVLYVGQAYYNHWYLSRELRKLGWKADQLNLDRKENSAFFHGQDIAFFEEQYSQLYQKLNFYLYALDTYEIFHFANATGIYFLTDFDSNAPKKTSGLAYSFFSFLFNKVLKWKLNNIYRLVYFIGIKRSIRLMQKYKNLLPERWDILLIKKIGKKIVYTNNGCHDGLLQTTFAKWPTPDHISICGICPHKDDRAVCSDEKMKKWGEFRNSVCDYQCLLGGNRADYNVGANIHEVPEVYCLDKNFWQPDLLIPTNYKLPIPAGTVKIYHSVGNFEFRSQLGAMTIKSTHIYVPLIEKMKKDGYNVEMIFFNDVPNKKLRYYQAQADIVVDMLTYGFFGANIREAMMLGKPCVCYIRPEWLEQMKAEIPDYVAELPIVSADPTNIESVLADLIANPKKREEIGRKSREFAVKWHSSEVGAKRFEGIYSSLANY